MNRQTQFDHLPPHLPRNCGAFRFKKRADITLAFKLYHDRVRKTLDDIRSKRLGMNFSQMFDAYTSSVVLGCGLEIKESGGDYNEAIVQLGIWYSAGPEKTRGMIITPLLGWTVIGHEWRPHISRKDEKTGNMVGHHSHYQSDID